MGKKVFCYECKWLEREDDTAKCLSPKNKFIKYSWLHSWYEAESPVVLNAKNNCKFFEKKK